MAITREYSMLGTMKGSALGQLTNILESHLRLMKEKDAQVNKIIQSSPEQSRTSLRDAKFKALQQEKNLLLGIMDDITEMTDFLKKIVLIENLYNSQYDPLKSSQETARNKYAARINKYENKQKHLSDVSSFVELIFSSSTHLSSLQNVIDNVSYECEVQNIQILSNSGAVMKKMARAFYKAFYVYNKSNEGYKHMCDILRCSLVFNDFESIYKTFSIIETILRPSGGILNVKDRFQAHQIEFGYRDLLINFYIPNAKIICEMQLHHKLFYQYKKISHNMYKYARLFERDDRNLAYDYSKKHMQQKIGTKQVYQPTPQELNIGQQYWTTKQQQQQQQQQEFEKFVPKSCEEYIKEWGLHRFWDKFVENGYDYQIEDFKELLDDQTILKNDVGLKSGHLKRFIRNCTKLFEEIEKYKNNPKPIAVIAQKNLKINKIVKPTPIPESITIANPDEYKEEGILENAENNQMNINNIVHAYGRKELIQYESVNGLLQSHEITNRLSKSKITLTDIDLQILTRVDRRLFVNIDVYDVVNSSGKPCKIGYGVNLSAPTIHIRAMKKFEFLFKNNKKPINFLDVGCGTGYFTTIIAVAMIMYKCPFGSQVRGMEFHSNLVSQARYAAISMGIENIIHYHKCDTDFNNIGLKDFAPYDGIYVGAAINQKDKEILKLQLAINGLLLAVVINHQNGKQELIEITRSSKDKFIERVYLYVRFKKLRDRLEFL